MRQRCLPWALWLLLASAGQVALAQPDAGAADRAPGQLGAADGGNAEASTAAGDGADGGAADGGAADGGAADGGAVEGRAAGNVAAGQGAPELLPGDRSRLPSLQVIGPPECPNAARLVAELEAGDGELRLRPAEAGSPSSGFGDFVVQFRPWGDRYDAEIRDSAGRVRSLEGDGSGCAELGRAVGLSMLVLVDAAAQGRRASLPGTKSIPEQRIPEDPRGGAWRPRFGASLGIGGVLPPLPFVGAYARFTGPVEISSWFAYGPGYTRAYGPGQVRLWWLGMGSEACYVLFDLLGLCGGGWVARLSATGSGYDRNSSVARWQPGLSFGARFRGALGEHWELGLTAMGLLALTKERITVANVEGDAFTTYRLNPMIGLELGAHF